jgi:hypothetical protein
MGGQIVGTLREYGELVIVLLLFGVFGIGHYIGRISERQEWQRRERARMQHKYGRGI